MSKPEWVSSFEPYAKQIIDAYQCPGLVLGVAVNGQPLYGQGFGSRDVQQGLPITADTVAGIASCTKSFTAVAIMQLQEAGRLSVHDPVVKYLPEFRTPDPEATGAITLHHLLTQTSGLPPQPWLWHAIARATKGDGNLPATIRADEILPIESFDDLIKAIGSHEFHLIGAPGERFSYSNDSYALLGAVIERVSGQRYESYIEEQILRPAGMERTTFALSKLEAMENVTTLYAVRPKDGGGAGEQEAYPSPTWQELGPFAAGGGLRSTVSDMLRYTEVYRTGGLVGDVRILSRESVRAMMQPYTRAGRNVFYGYGLMIYPDYHGVTLVEHGGALKGVSSLFSVIPERGITGAVLNNLGGVASAQVLLGAFNAMLGLPLDTRRTEYGTYYAGDQDFALYAGEYRSGEGARITVSVKEGGLDVSVRGSQNMDLHYLPAGQHLFRTRVKETDLAIEFLLNEAGEVWALTSGLRVIPRA